MKTKLIVIALALMFIFTACSKTPSVIEIEAFDGSVVEVSTDGLSDEQIEAIQSVAENGNMQNLMISGLFTADELSELGLSMGGGNAGGNPGGRMQGDGEFAGGMPGDMDFSDINIDDLDTESLNDEQIDLLNQLIAGDVELEDVIAGEILTMEDLQAIGAIQGFGGMDDPRGGMGNPQGEGGAPPEGEDRPEDGTPPSQDSDG